MFFFSLFLTFYLHGEVFDGYTLFTPKSAQEDGASTYLINNNYEILAHKMERILRENGIKKTNISDTITAGKILWKKANNLNNI